MPLSDEELLKLRTAFRPHAPIEDPTSFVGRQDQLRRVREAINEPGLQVVVYGERGCGKTSLANVATTSVPRLQVFCEKDATFPGLLRDIAMRFQALHPREIIFDAVRDSIVVSGVILPANALTGNMLLQLLSFALPICIVLDELDRIKNKSVVTSLAEVAKNAATYHVGLTFVMIGVADTADKLLVGHASNFRNLRQVALGRMSGAELREILERGQRVLGLTFNPQVVHKMVSISDQMPYYLHLLATNAARSALERDSQVVELRDLLAGSASAAQDVDQLLRDVYDFAILSEKGSHIYRRLVWAMAEMDGTSCNVGVINDKANEIARAEGAATVSPQALGAALKRLLADEKRKIVSQATTGVYKFTNPLMKGFVRIRRFGS